jgi:rSAM/selenodomain-associated transferase 1
VGRPPVHRADGRVGSVELEDRCVLFFIKNPKKGKVKTRLASAIGDDAAVKLYRRFLLEMLSTLNRGTFLFYLCYHPEDSLKDLKNWLGEHYLYTPQTGENLGEKMKNAFNEAFSMHFKRVLLIGSDIPDLPLEFIDEAFKSLEEKDAVIGPSVDGGYYLIGFKDKTFLPQVFERIPWSTERVFDETMKILETQQLTIHTLQLLRDMDTVEDLSSRRF